MKNFKFVLVAFALLSFISFFGCQSSTKSTEDALNELNTSLDEAVDELETDIQDIEEEVVDTTVVVEEATE
ncbi:MAG: hypothetical protein ABIJ97_04615 [Bacteroidota bacterium]